jgi:antitoxin HigA-1
MTTRKRSEAVKRLDKIIGEEESLGGFLWAIRVGDELSLESFAKKLKISKQNLCDIEKGRKFVSPERAARFAKILGHSEITFVELALQDIIRNDGLKLKVKVEAA